MTTPGTVGYTVTAVTPSVDFGPTGGQIPGKTLTFTTTTGYEGTLFVPTSVFGDIPAVQAMIEAEVAQVIAAQQIAGTVKAG
jgi:hypothetical protein